jgi:hypothetical protein
VLTEQLYQANSIGVTWYVFAAVGVASALMIYAYGRWIRKIAERETPKA